MSITRKLGKSIDSLTLADKEKSYKDAVIALRVPRNENIRESLSLLHITL